MALSSLPVLLDTLTFASNKHAFQRRKDPDQTPYINHPIAVSNFIAQTGETDIIVLQAAILHDVIEVCPIRSLFPLSFFLFRPKNRYLTFGIGSGYRVYAG